MPVSISLSFEGWLLVRIGSNKPIAFKSELFDLIAEAEKDYCDNPDAYFCDIYYNFDEERNNDTVPFYMNFTDDPEPIYYAYRVKGNLT